MSSIDSLTEGEIVHCRIGESTDFDLVHVLEIRPEHVVMRISSRRACDGAEVFYSKTVMHKSHIKDVIRPTVN